jgi:hypothetical protein
MGAAVALGGFAAVRGRPVCHVLLRLDWDVYPAHRRRDFYLEF